MNPTSYGIALVRIVLGLTFLLHGLDKFTNGIEGTAGFFSSIGIPGFMAYFVATVELVGGALVMVGLFSRLISAMFVVIMLVAIFTVKIGAGFVGGYELDLALLVMSVLIAVDSRSALSLDAVLFGKKEAA
nr:DoxX family protein [Paenibacillus sp. 481]